jgi:hypothetical protein
MGDREIHFQNGPVVSVHKGWRISKSPKLGIPKKKSRASQDGSSESNTTPRSRSSGSSEDSPKSQEISNDQTFEFVNVSTQVQPKDRNSRKVKKTHVVQRHRRKISRQALQSYQTNEISPLISEISDQENQHLYRDYIGIDALRTLGTGVDQWFGKSPTDLNPRLHDLVSRYISSTVTDAYPMMSHLRFQALKEMWFHFSTTDSAVFHAFLFAAAACLGILSDVKESAEAASQMELTIKLVSKRLNDKSQEVSDISIGAVTCLAFGSVR